MYQNGKRVNGYQRKRLHKRKVKQSYAKSWIYGDGMTAWNNLVIEFKDEPRTKWGHPLDYWKDYSRSDLRQEAKRQTNRALRREFKDILRNEFDDFPKLASGEYKRYYDYGWTVW